MDRIDDLLNKTSRTFALSIPLLPAPTRHQLSIAYLLFRIADTFEDAATWTRAHQVQALDEFVELIAAPDAEAAASLGDRWAAEIPIEHEGYLELLRATPLVMRELEAVAPAARAILVDHTTRTAQGMRGFVERGVDGFLRLEDMEDLRRYCYTVAGIVGELSTELFLLDRPSLAPVADRLREWAPRFGEALQLVNILKDSAFDTDEGRCYLPPSLARAEVFALAREDLDIGAEYTCTLQSAGAERGIVAFCALPVRLAYEALDRVEQSGPGAKVGRERVWEIVADLNRALDAGEPAVRPGATTGSR